MIRKWYRRGTGYQKGTLKVYTVSDNRAVIGIMDWRRSEANLLELRDPILPSHDVIWLGVYPPPTTLLAPSPAFPSLLEAAPPKIEFVRRVNQVVFVQQVGDCCLPFVTGVFNINVEVAHDNGAAVGRARFPCRLKVISPPRVVGGDIYPHDVISFVTRHQLEGDEVGGHDFCGLHLKSLMVWLPEQGNPPFMLAQGFCQEHLGSRRHAGVAVIGNFHFRQNRTPDPIFASPLAANVNPFPRPQRIFHAATEKVPRPPDEGGAEEADIVMIINQLT